MGGTASILRRLYTHSQAWNGERGDGGCTRISEGAWRPRKVSARPKVTERVRAQAGPGRVQAAGRSAAGGLTGRCS